MAGNNKNPPPYQPFLIHDTVAIPGKLHDMIKHLENFLPKFDHDRKYSIKDHIKKLLLAM